MRFRSSKHEEENINEIYGALSYMAQLQEELERISQKGRESTEQKRVFEEEISKLNRDIGKGRTDIEDTLELIHDLEKQIENIKEKIVIKRDSKDGLEDEIKNLENCKREKSQNIEDTELVINRIKLNRNKIESLISENRAKIPKIILKSRRKKNPGPEKEIIKISEKNKTQTNGIFALGDIHGWAPGLFNYLVKTDTADISFNDIDWKEIQDEGIFKWRPTNFSYRTPPGLDGSPFRPKSEPTLFNNIDLRMKKKSEKRRLIFIGDLIDRGDHSELVVEAIRQLISREPGSCFSLIGNHEGMVILDKYEQWSKNEKDFLYNPGVKNQPFTVSHHPEVTGEKKEEDGMLLNFEAIRSSIGVLLLSQHFSLLHSMSTEDRTKLQQMIKPTWDKLGLKPKKVKKKLDIGGWEMYHQGSKFLDLLNRKVSDKEAIIIPGALVSWYQDNSFFLHAEPNGVADLERDIEDEIEGIGGMKNSWDIGGNKVHFQLASIKKDINNKIFICQANNGGLLWARGKNRQLDVQNGVKLLKKMFPNLENIVHGHTAQESVKSINVTTPDGDVCVNNIDESIGPNPRFNVNLDQEYGINIIPEGWFT
ncbi:metallophosphoesterase [Euryarchaeota archaeon]|nr:metallophosphoesterase [Euryarchaeota archaeon]